MIKHIVVFKLKSEAQGRRKEENLDLIVSRLKLLPDKIDVIREYEIGINIIEGVLDYDLVLVSVFDSLVDLEIYRHHEEHQQVVALINQICETRATVDYEVA